MEGAEKVTYDEFKEAYRKKLQEVAPYLEVTEAELLKLYLARLVFGEWEYKQMKKERGRNH